jgi:hypothetical protein
MNLYEFLKINKLYETKLNIDKNKGTVSNARPVVATSYIFRSLITDWCPMRDRS